MKRLFASIVFIAMLCSGFCVAGAQTPPPPATGVTSCPPGETLVQAYTKTSGKAVAAHCKKAKHSHSGAMGAAAPGGAAAAAAPVPAAATNSTATSRGAAETDTAAMSCPAGKHYVHGYTTKKGKVVKGYCRKSHAKASS